MCDSGSFAICAINEVVSAFDSNYSNYSNYSDSYPFIDTGVGANGERGDGQPLGYGCGDASTDSIVPDRIGNIDLLPACQAHDQCYDTGTTTPRAVCDANLGVDVYNSCVDAGHSDFLCSALGNIYQIGVELGGASSYNPAP